jgi:hypothetical protein
MNIEKAYRLASQQYLTAELPEDWQQMDEEEFNSFLKDNAWEPFENWEGSDIWEQIDQTAQTFSKNFTPEPERILFALNFLKANVDQVIDLLVYEAEQEEKDENSWATDTDNIDKLISQVEKQIQ